VVKKKNTNGLPAYRRHQFPLDRLFGHQPDRPAGATFWGIAADHRDDPLLLIRVEYFGGTRPRLLIKGAVEAGLLVTVAESAA